MEMEPLINAYVAADLLDVPYRSLMRALKRPDNEIPFIKVGNIYRFDKEAILKKARGEHESIHR